jgi:hypothetical protein
LSAGKSQVQRSKIVDIPARIQARFGKGRMFIVLGEILIHPAEATTYN